MFLLLLVVIVIVIHGVEVAPFRFFRNAETSSGYITSCETQHLNSIGVYDGIADAEQPLFAFFATSMDAICVYSSVGDAVIALYDELYYPIGVVRTYLGSYNSDTPAARNGYITRDLKYAVKGTKLYSLAIDTDLLKVTATEVREVNSGILPHSGLSSGYINDPQVLYITDASSKILMACTLDTDFQRYTGTFNIYEYYVDFDTKNNEVFKLKTSYGHGDLGTPIDYNISTGEHQLAIIKSTTDGNEIFSSIYIDRYDNNVKVIEMVNAMPDYNEVVALKYNGDYYYRLKGGGLTAMQDDVAAGKTFIGWNGYAETGTMEVEKNE